MVCLSTPRSLTTLKKKYEAVMNVLVKIRDDQLEWDMCVELKMVNLLLGQQSGFTKYPCLMEECAEENEEEAILDDDALHPFSHMELNDLVRDLGMSKSSAELLASRLKENNSLSNSALITFYRNRREGLNVLYGYCTASAQAWSATVQTRRLETVH